VRFDLSSLLAEAWASVEDPRSAARRVQALNLPLPTAAQALLLVALLTGLLTALVNMIGQSVDPTGPMAALSPLTWVVLQAVGLFIVAGAIHIVGRGFGGRGDLAGAVALLAWSQFILLIVQIVQIVALFLFPPLTVFLAMAAVVLTFWLLSHFIAELHGFPSAIKVLFGILATGIAFAVAVSVLLAIFVGAAAS